MFAATFTDRVATPSVNRARTTTIDVVELADQGDRIPDRLAVDLDRGRGHEDGDQREDRHGRRQAEGLADRLLPLALPEPGEVGHVQRERRPEGDHAHQGRREDAEPELVDAPADGAVVLEERAEAAGLDGHPDQQEDRDDEDERGGPVLEPPHGVHAAPDDDDVEEPEDREAQPHRPGLRVTEPDRDLAGVRPPGAVAEDLARTTKIAPPPIQVWMPNQPQATPARIRAGRLAPKTPNDARAKTGYGMPYFVPAWLFEEHRHQAR